MKHAVHQWKADIISLSCGFEDHSDELEQAIREAESHHVLIFAASGNFGANKKTSWPARHRSVIPVYGSDGDGNPYKKNPNPQPDGSRFSTLGVAVKVTDHTNSNKRQLRSGTSIATAVAVGIASTMLGFMRSQREKYLEMTALNNDFELNRRGESREQGYDRLIKTMLRPIGMEAVFRLMSEERDGYNYIAPWNMSSKYGFGVHLVTTILRALKDA